jgi:hypothetical protein
LAGRPRQNSALEHSVAGAMSSRRPVKVLLKDIEASIKIQDGVWWL